MSDTIDSGSYAALYLDGESGEFHIQPHHWDEIDAAYHNWVERRIDRVLSLTCDDGRPLLIAASRVGGLAMSTPEYRQRSRELDDARKAEGGFIE